MDVLSAEILYRICEFLSGKECLNFILLDKSNYRAIIPFIYSKRYIFPSNQINLRKYGKYIRHLYPFSEVGPGTSLEGMEYTLSPKCYLYLSGTQRLTGEQISILRNFKVKELNYKCDLIEDNCDHPELEQLGKLLKDLDTVDISLCKQFTDLNLLDNLSKDVKDLTLWSRFENVPNPKFISQFKHLVKLNIFAFNIKVDLKALFSIEYSSLKELRLAGYLRPDIIQDTVTFDNRNFSKLELLVMSLDDLYLNFIGSSSSLKYISFRSQDSKVKESLTELFLFTDLVKADLYVSDENRFISNTSPAAVPPTSLRGPNMEYLTSFVLHGLVTDLHLLFLFKCPKLMKVNFMCIYFDVEMEDFFKEPVEPISSITELWTYKPKYHNNTLVNWCLENFTSLDKFYFKDCSSLDFNQLRTIYPNIEVNFFH